MSFDERRRWQLADAVKPALGDAARITLMEPTIMATVAAALVP